MGIGLRSACNGYGYALDLDAVEANPTQSHPVRRVVTGKTGLPRIAPLPQDSERPWRQRRRIFMGF